MSSSCCCLFPKCVSVSLIGGWNPAVQGTCPAEMDPKPVPDISPTPAPSLLLTSHHAITPLSSLIITKSVSVPGSNTLLHQNSDPCDGFIHPLPSASLCLTQSPITTLTPCLSGSRCTCSNILKNIHPAVCVLNQSNIFRWVSQDSEHR